MALQMLARRSAGTISKTLRFTSVRLFSGENPLAMPSADKLADEDFIDVYNDDYITGIEDMTEGLKYPNMANSVEWLLSSPPPVHCFDEPPIMVECTDDTACEWINPTN